MIDDSVYVYNNMKKDNKKRNIVVIIIIFFLLLVVACIALLTTTKFNNKEITKQKDKRCVDDICISSVSLEETSDGKLINIVIKNLKKREEETFLLVIKRPFKYKGGTNEKDYNEAYDEESDEFCCRIILKKGI